MHKWFILLQGFQSKWPIENVSSKMFHLCIYYWDMINWLLFYKLLHSLFDSFSRQNDYMIPHILACCKKRDSNKWPYKLLIKSYIYTPHKNSSLLRPHERKYNTFTATFLFLQALWKKFCKRDCKQTFLNKWKSTAVLKSPMLYWLTRNAI